MQKRSTLKQSSEQSSKQNVGTYIDMEPAKDILMFLKQFARIYHVETQLPAQISGVVLN
ncbi:hypothetical protein LJB98_05135 [Bacteroidales bacterium OttesenSCG-928-M11]|nr:hypothetical protein [Bacteroidales bacterium OttesenSCG-928-M11]